MLYIKQVVFPRIKRKRLAMQGYSFFATHSTHTYTQNYKLLIFNTL